ncbi:MAG: hypothetical protein IPK03_04820 [Bacteroidetes bacterium]|nr:hypothetical protein [Bacteroidota bacterium]
MFVFKIEIEKNTKWRTHILKVSNYKTQVFKASFDTNIVQKLGVPMVYETNDKVLFFNRNIFNNVTLNNCIEFDKNLSSYKFKNYSPQTGLFYPSFKILKSSNDTLMLFGVFNKEEVDKSCTMAMGF